ncbi:MAG TPA: DUF3052 domain-containing protein [Candidatus Thermoplasmatota archaeon]|nr:DUF3052 domain-containing protein [Candidatus Thermoplasmatota archaeon]
MPSGYSGTPLVRKLGFRPGHRVAFAGAPAGFVASLELPPGVKVLRPASRDLDLVHLFASSAARLARAFPSAKRALAKTGMLWVSWPKGSSGVDTDLTEDVVRSMGLAHGLVDVKVCAVDGTWSGLKFVYRLADR